MKIEAIGDVLVSVVIESDLGQIELEVEGDLETNSEVQDHLFMRLVK
jgi:hypothetical protein